MNGHSTVVRKPIGKIKIVKYHRTPRGVLYNIGDIFDYYSIFTTNGCNCGGAVAKQSYRIKGGTIPLDKAIILK